MTTGTSLTNQSDFKSREAMGHQEPSVDRLKNEIARLTIERNHYRKALFELTNQLWEFHKNGTTLLTSKHISIIIKNANDAWNFRQPGCPQCGMSCKFTFAMVEVGPDIRLWDCPNCGKTVNTDTVFEEQTT